MNIDDLLKRGSYLAILIMAVAFAWYIWHITRPVKCRCKVRSISE